MGALGGRVQQNNPLCCMVCNPMAFPEVERLFLGVGKAPPRKKRRVAVRKQPDQPILDNLQSKLKEKRAEYIVEHSSLEILGEQLVCPDSVIDSICGSAKYISVFRDMDSFCLRQELRQTFFDIVMSSVISLS